MYRVGCNLCKVQPFKNVGEGTKLLYRHELGMDHISAINRQTVWGAGTDKQQGVLAIANQVADGQVAAADQPTFPCVKASLKNNCTNYKRLVMLCYTCTYIYIYICDLCMQMQMHNKYIYIYICINISHAVQLMVLPHNLMRYN